jgi:hypothetical protein
LSSLFPPLRQVAPPAQKFVDERSLLCKLTFFKHPATSTLIQASLSWHLRHFVHPALYVPGRHLFNTSLEVDLVKFLRIESPLVSGLLFHNRCSECVFFEIWT